MPVNEYNPKLETDTSTRTQVPPAPEAVHSRQRLLGIVLVIIGLVWLVNSTLPMAFERFFGERRSASFDQRYSTQHIILDAASSHVILQHSDEPQLRVRFEQNGSENGSVQVVQDGDILRISHQMTPCFFCDDDTMYKLDIPSDVQVDVNSVSGDIEAHDLRGIFSIASQSGEISLHNLQGSLRASSSSGDIRVDGSNMVEATLETTSGKIVFSGSSDTIVSKSVSGDIQIENDRASHFMLSTASGDLSYRGQPAGASDVTSISGDVKLRLNRESNTALALSTVSGDLNSDIDLSELFKNPQTLNGKMGAGMIPLNVHTTSGDIHVSLR